MLLGRHPSGEARNVFWKTTAAEEEAPCAGKSRPGKIPGGWGDRRAQREREAEVTLC